MVERYILSDVFDNAAYLLLKNVDGKIDFISCNALDMLLSILEEIIIIYCGTSS